MADAYYDYNNGSSGNSGSSPLLPKATRSQAVTAAGAGDKVIALDGVQTHESSFFDFNDNRLERSNTFRGATLNAHSSQTTRVARCSGTAGRDVNGLVFNGQSGSGGAVSYAFGFTSSGASVRNDVVSNCEFIMGANYCVNNEQQSSTQTLINPLFTGTFDNALDRAYRAPGGVLGLQGNQVVNLLSPTFNFTELTVSAKVIELAKAAAITNTVDINVINASGTIDIADATSVTAVFDVRTEDSIRVSNTNFTINADGATSVNGFILRGTDAANPSSDILMSGGTIEFNCPAGFAVQLGNSQGSGNGVSNGTLSGFTVKGKDFTGATPHNICIGEDVTGVGEGLTSHEGYVGFLLSLCTGGTFRNCLAYDISGPSFYMKGVKTAGSFDNCIAFVGSSSNQRERGILSVAPQVTDNLAGTFNDVYVIVEDLSSVHSLAYCEDADQVVTFNRNIYLVDEAQYDPASNYFSYNNGAGGAANETLAQWNAHSGNLTVNGDVIVTTTAAEIAKLKATLKPLAGSGGAGSKQIISNNIIS